MRRQCAGEIAVMCWGVVQNISFSLPRRQGINDDLSCLRFPHSLRLGAFARVFLFPCCYTARISDLQIVADMTINSFAFFARSSQPRDKER